MTDAELAEIEAMLEAAKPWPWFYNQLGVYDAEVNGTTVAETTRGCDAVFIAHAPENTRKLLAEVRRLNDLLDFQQTVIEDGQRQVKELEALVEEQKGWINQYIELTRK